MGSLANLTIQLTIFDGMKGARALDPELVHIMERIHKRKETTFTLSEEGILHLEGRLCVPTDVDIRIQLLFEVHEPPYSVHPWATKMYQGIREYFWWNGMKRDVAKYVSKCLTCQKVKAEQKCNDPKLTHVK